ncbi:putative proline-rich protein 36 [Iris pallida]|uniref:Proline-rich protein 36 n=1 Tax=Iris pallida TaxID=29817 RepID=A0AAX6GX88_IRIPA|nr:putative proline-rich protein 36 [Iris pallida]
MVGYRCCRRSRLEAALGGRVRHGRRREVRSAGFQRRKSRRASDVTVTLGHANPDSQWTGPRRGNLLTLEAAPFPGASGQGHSPGAARLKAPSWRLPRMARRRLSGQAAVKEERAPLSVEIAGGADSAPGSSWRRRWSLSGWIRRGAHWTRQIRPTVWLPWLVGRDRCYSGAGEWRCAEMAEVRGDCRVDSVPHGGVASLGKGRSVLAETTEAPLAWAGVDGLDVTVGALSRRRAPAKETRWRQRTRRLGFRVSVCVVFR